MNKELLRQFTLNLVNQPRIGSLTVSKLIGEFGGIDNLFLNPDSESFGKLSKQLFDAKNAGGANEKLLAKFGLSYKCAWEDDYPILLKEIVDHPAVLFYKGKWGTQAFSSCFTIVGTRDITSYGEKWCRQIASELSGLGYSIVSGMAFGVDKVAHLSCIDSKGKTIAVLADSAHKASPASNHDVYKKILDSGGLIISESMPGVKISAGMFANRNRILAGLSLGTVVIEAAKKSGSLITADLAFGYNREVFALPGSVDAKYSEGCNQLIKSGVAKLIQNVDDILVELGHLPVQITKTSEIELEENEKSIYNSILSEPKFVEEIAVEIRKNISEVLSICSLLELKSKIRKNEMGQYCI